MTSCECRALLDRIDEIRSRLLKIAVASSRGYALLDETIRHPAEMAEIFFWPGIVAAGLVALHFAIEWLIRGRRAPSG